MPQRVKARSILCYPESYESLGRRHGDSRRQGMTQLAISEAIWWGKEFSVNTNKSRMIGIHYFMTVRQLPQILAAHIFFKFQEVQAALSIAARIKSRWHLSIRRGPCIILLADEFLLAI
jgi:hypothetical protein